MMSIQLRDAFELAGWPSDLARPGWLDLASTGSIWLPLALWLARSGLPDVVFLLPPAVWEARRAPQALIFELERDVFSRFCRARSLRRAIRATSTKHQ